MLITHVWPNDLLGKDVYDKEGRLLGHVTAIAGRHGVVRAVLLRRPRGEVVRLAGGAVDSKPRLRVVR